MMLSKQNKKRHFTATAYIVHNNKVLLVNHKKLKKWLPIGGHIEGDEIPDKAVLREVMEETGLNVEIVGDSLLDFDLTEILNRPFVVALQQIDDKHQHIDLQYICRVKGGKELNGTEKCMWFARKELANLKNCPREIKFFATKAMDIAKNSEDITS